MRTSGNAPTRSDRNTVACPECARLLAEFNRLELASVQAMEMQGTGAGTFDGFEFNCYGPESPTHILIWGSRSRNWASTNAGIRKRTENGKASPTRGVRTVVAVRQLALPEKPENAIGERRTSGGFARDRQFADGIDPHFDRDRPESASLQRHPPLHHGRLREASRPRSLGYQAINSSRPRL